MRRVFMIAVVLFGGCLELPAALPESASADSGLDAGRRDARDEKGDSGDADTTVDMDPGGDAGTTVLRFKEVSAGGSHVCAIAEDDTLWCWGANGSGQSDPDSKMDEVVEDPAQIITGDGHDTFSTVAAGRYHTCAAVTGVGVFCWGSNDEGQKNPADDDADTGLSAVIDVAVEGARLSASETHTCVTDDDGALQCWGASGGSAVGGVGPGPNDFGGFVFAEVAVSKDVTLAVNEGGELFVWGDVSREVAPDVDTMDCPLMSCDMPVKWTGDGDVLLAHPAAGTRHACAIAANTEGALWCWGANDEDQVVSHVQEEFTAPVTTNREAAMADGTIAVGRTHTCAVQTLENDGANIECWGNDDHDKAPLVVAGNYFAVTAGDQFSCGIKFDGHVSNARVGDLFCWGDNAAGQLGPGDPDIDSGLVPVIIEAPRR